MTRLLLALLLALPAIAGAKPPEIYLEAALGRTEQAAQLDALDPERRPYTLGKAAVGVEWRGLLLELEHISDVSDRDRGLNTIWLGIRHRP